MSCHGPVGMHRRRMRGVGLIEVLIALLVLSVGLLGVVGMQVTAKKANYEAVQRTTAAHLAADLIERVRANPTGDYVTGAVIGATALDPAADEPSPNCYEGKPCTVAELVAMDLFQWTLQMQGLAETRDVGGVTRATGGLVSPRACLIGPAGTTGYYQLAITWRGTEELTAVPLDSAYCGGGLTSTTLYGSESDDDDDTHRRIFLVEFYISV